MARRLEIGVRGALFFTAKSVFALAADVSVLYLDTPLVSEFKLPFSFLLAYIVSSFVSGGKNAGLRALGGRQ